MDPRPPDASSSRFRCCARSFAASSSPASATAFRDGRLVVSGRLAPLATDVRLSRVPPIALSPAVGGLREAALWQPRPRAALPRALHPPRRHLQSPARRRHRRHRLVSVEGLSAREPDAHADARRRRIPPPLPPPRPPETLRPHPLLRPARAAVPHPTISRRVARSWRSRRQPPVTAPSVGSTSRASWPCPRCGAPMRIVERLTARQLFLEALLADIVHDSS